MFLVGERTPHLTRQIPLMRTLVILALLSTPSLADMTSFIDIYRGQHSVTYTNVSDIPLRCQISSRVDPDLPLGQLAETRNITIREYMSYTHLRNPRTQLIYCEFAFSDSEESNDRKDNR